MVHPVLQEQAEIQVQVEQVDQVVQAELQAHQEQVVQADQVELQVLQV